MSTNFVLQAENQFCQCEVKMVAFLLESFWLGNCDSLLKQEKKVIKCYTHLGSRANFCKTFLDVSICAWLKRRV